MANIGRPLKYKTVEELQEAIDDYFDSCVPEVIKDAEGNPVMGKNGMPVLRLNPPTITGLALHLGFVDRRSIYDYKDREEFSLTIKEARLKCENYVESASMDGSIPPAVGIFILKNYNWSDKQEIDFRDKTDYEEQERKLKEIARKAENISPEQKSPEDAS